MFFFEHNGGRLGMYGTMVVEVIMVNTEGFVR